MSSLSFKPGSPRVLKTGEFIVAIGLIAFGVQNFLYHDFIAGRAPAWTYGTSANLIWAYLTGVIFIITGILVGVGKPARIYLILCSILILVWAVFRHIPILAEINFRWSGELTNGGKAITIFGGVMAVAALLPQEHSGLASKLSGLVNQTNLFTFIGRYCMGIFLVICGYEHFLFIDFVKTLVPEWIPGNIFWTYFAGVALMAGGIGLFIPRTAPLTGWLTGIMIFIWFAILHLPRGFASNDQNEWTAVVEAFTFSGIAFALTRKTN